MQIEFSPPPFSVYHSLSIHSHCSVRDEAKELISHCTTRANRTQNDVTEKLGERIQDVSYWKFELERGVQDMTSEETKMG